MLSDCLPCLDVRSILRRNGDWTLAFVMKVSGFNSISEFAGFANLWTLGFLHLFALMPSYETSSMLAIGVF